MGEAAVAHLRAPWAGQRRVEKCTRDDGSSDLERDFEGFGGRAAPARSSAARSAEAPANRLAVDRHSGRATQTVLQSLDADAYQSDVGKYWETRSAEGATGPSKHTDEREQRRTDAQRRGDTRRSCQSD